MNSLVLDRATKCRSRTLYWATALSSFLLAFATFSAVTRGEREALGALDVIALMKVGTRAFVALLLSLMIVRIWSHPARKRITACWACFFPFVVWAGMSAFWSPLRSVSVGQLSSVFVLMLVCLSAAILSVQPSMRKALLRNLSLILVMVSCALIAIHFVFPNWNAFERVGSGIFHPTNAGATASLGLVLLVSCRLIWDWKWANRLLVPGVILHLTAILLSANRVSFALAIAIPMIPIAIYANRKLLASVFLMATTATLGFLFLDPGFESVESVSSGAVVFVQREQSAQQLKSLSGREEMWKAMWKSHQDSPLKGHGYFVTSERGRIKVWDAWGNWTAHNMFLQCLTTTGFIGVVLFYGGQAMLMICLVVNWNRGQMPHKIMMLVGLVGSWYFFWSLFNSSILGPLQPESLVFYTIAGIAIGSISSAPQSESPHDAIAASTTLGSGRYGRRS